MKLVIMRHGQAQWSAPSDAERALTRQGQNETCYVAEKLAERLCITHLLASPYRRAQQTAKLVAKALKVNTIETVDWLIPDGKPEAVINQLPDVDSLLLVSHMPLVSQLTGLLCEASTQQTLSFHTSAAAIIELQYAAIGTGQLVDTVIP